MIIVIDFLLKSYIFVIEILLKVTLKLNQLFICGFLHFLIFKAFKQNYFIRYYNINHITFATSLIYKNHL